MPHRRELALTCLFLLVLLAGCGSNNSNSTNPPAAVTVTVAPATLSVQTGGTQQFTATVANTTNTAVAWQVNGVAGGNATVGTISLGGLYTAPASVPAPAAVTVTAVSQADNTKSGTSSVTVTIPPPVTVTVAPATISVVIGATQQFTATVANTANSAVNWQVNGVAGGNATVGTISASGLYTAPAVVPSPAAVTVTAVSQADNTKSGNANVTITAPPPITVAVAPPTANVVVGATQQFTATVANTANTAVTWEVNGVAGGNSTVGTISATGLYTGPVSVPNPATVTVTAISSADNTKTGSATVTVTAAPTISVTVGPATAPVQVNATQQFTATVTGTANTAVTWQAGGVNGGNATVGTISNTGLYTAPSAVPSPATVTITAISSADNTKTGTATVTVTSAPPPVVNRFVYVASFPDNNIKIFSVNDTTGALTASGTTSTGAGTNPGFLAMHPTGKFLYSLNISSGNISIFTVNATTGALTAAGTATAAAGPHYMVFSSDGKFAYATCETASSVVGYSVNTTTGALAAISGTPLVIAGGGRIRGIAITPDNKHLYVSDTDATPNGIHAYTINSTTGVLTEISGSPFSGDFIGTLVTDKSGKFLYAADPGDVVVSAYSITAATGALTFINDFNSGGASPAVWTFDATGAVLYGGNVDSNQVFGFKVNTDGTLTMITGMPVSTGTMPGGGGTHPNGKFAYVVNQISDTSITPGSINTYSVNTTTGAFTLQGSMATGSNNSAGFAITP
jgi:6-phosphogluconolactonase (cycloisomerase 2 family)